MKNRLKLYFFGVSLGFKSLFKLKKISPRILEMVITPMNYWRSIETPLILNSLKPKRGERILDIGSPKLLSFFLAKKVKSKIISSDINPYFINYCQDFCKVLNIYNRYNIKIIDARNIKIKNNSIDKIYALSVFEHIPGEGDINAVREVRRILKKGGIFVLTMPYSKKFKLTFKNPKRFYWSNNSSISKSSEEKDKIFYERAYNEKELYNRIIKPSKMKVLLKQYVSQKCYIPPGLFSSFLGPFNLILSKLNHIEPVKDLNQIEEPCLVHLVLKK